MKDNTKITLSAKELELVCNTDWILTKQIIIRKVYELFGQIAAETQLQLTALHPGLSEITSPKISRGEFYKQLPYVVLDYPRIFSKNDTAAIRTFFWWGNFCSVTVQLSGIYKTAATEKLLQQYPLFCSSSCSICIASSPWEHHFEEDNFVDITAISFDEFTDIITTKPFIKIAKKIPLSEWENLHAFIFNSFMQFQQFLYAPSR